MKAKLTFSIFVLFALATPAAFGQAPDAGDPFKKFDKNGDGKVTKEEAGDAPWFDKVDQNKDGVLDGNEIEKLKQARGNAKK